MTRLEAEEQRLKPVRLNEYTEVTYTPLDAVPEITLEFRCGGGPFCYFTYSVRGGPDDGKRVQLYQWIPKDHLDGQEKHYNGTKEEFDSYIGYPARPGFSAFGGLHVATATYIRGWLSAMRDEAVAKEYDRSLNAAYAA